MPGAWDEDDEDDDEEMYDEEGDYIYPYISATNFESDITVYEQGMGWRTPIIPGVINSQ